MDNSDETTKVWFDPSKVKVEADDQLRGVFDDEALVGLSAAPSGSTLSASLNGDSVQLKVDCPGVLTMERNLVQKTTGGWYVFNTNVRVHPLYSGKNFAARTTVIQARAAQRLGFESIDLYAAGDYSMANIKFPEDRWVGYWVWPRLGFDADIPSHVQIRLPPDLSSCTKISELMATVNGQEAWKIHGDGVDVSFDLTAGSVSWNLLERYTADRNIKV